MTLRALLLPVKTLGGQLRPGLRQKYGQTFHTMAVIVDENNALSSYAKGLAIDIRERYKIKIKECEGTDPYTLTE